MADKKWEIEVASVDASGNLENNGTASPAKGVIFPTSDPGIAGAWWDNAGTLTKSAG
jgi:hypothetical protein